MESERVLSRPAFGVLAGLVIGIVLDVMFDWFGARSNPLSVLAVPIAAAVIGLTMGMLLSVTERSRVEPPAREGRFVRPGGASMAKRFDPAHRR